MRFKMWKPATCGSNYERNMNQGSNPPSGQPGGGKGRRRRRGRRGPATQGAHPHQSGQGLSQGPSHGPGQQRHGKARKSGHRPGGRPGQNQPGSGISRGGLPIATFPRAAQFQQRCDVSDPPLLALLRHSGRLRIRQPSETLASALGSARGTRQGRYRRSRGNTDPGPVDRAPRGTGLQRLRRMLGRVRATPDRLFADGV